SGTADALATDEMIITYYNATQDYWVVSANAAQRDDVTLAIADTVAVAGDVIHVYTALSRADISKVSDSVYNAVTVTA
ncbi:MAG: DUF6266 family protein, partial [Pseudomonadota bacterium]